MSVAKKGHFTRRGSVLCHWKASSLQPIVDLSKKILLMVLFFDTMKKLLSA